MLLAYLYPELTGQWMVRHAGTFYRNYNSDIMALYEDEPTVVLSRDGFLQLLPQGLFTGLASEQMKLLKDAFVPFDAYWFNTKLQVELQVSQLLEYKLAIVLRTFFDFDLAAQTNPFVRKAAVLLPFVRSKRGDWNFIRDMLSVLAGCPVTMRRGRYSEKDSSVAALPQVQYELQIPALTTEQYNRLAQDMQPLFDFIREWLIPFEVVAQFNIKDYQLSTVGQGLTLNYNTRI